MSVTDHGVYGVSVPNDRLPMSQVVRRLYRAPLVLPVVAEPIVDGAVLTEDGKVRAVGPYPELRAAVSGAELSSFTDYEGHVLIPALVNGHSHLELSHLAAISREFQPRPGDLVGWIRHLLAQRAAQTDSQAPADAALLALARLFAGGCRTVIDIGNDPAAAAWGRNFKLDVLFHYELLGLCGAAEEEALARLRQATEDEPALCCTAHAPYSTGPRLLTALKKRATAAGCRFPIHLAESAAEVEFLASGGGPLREFILERGAQRGPKLGFDLAEFRPPGLSPVAWLDSLGLLDENTLCVHTVQIDGEDAALLAQRHAGVCLCPGANRYLGVGKAPLPLLLAAGILPCLGTDSMAGNQGFSLWHEMKVLRQDHPQVPPATVLAMATRAGASFLGREGETGVIAPGVDSALPAVVCPELGAGVAAALEYLTTAGEDLRLEWIE